MCIIHRDIPTKNILLFLLYISSSLIAIFLNTEIIFPGIVEVHEKFVWWWVEVAVLKENLVIGLGLRQGKQ